MNYKLKRYSKMALVLPLSIGAAWWVKKKFKKEVNNLTVTNVDVQNCIDKCTQAAQKIRTTANDMVDHRARYALAEADRHIELCIHGCFDAKSMTES